MKSFISTLALLITFGLSGTMAQQTSFMLLDKSTMEIEGTSTVHDWTSNVEKINANINFEPSALNSDTLTNPIKNFQLMIPVKSIKSGKGGMDRRTYKALKEEDNPNIIFGLTSAEFTETTDSTFTFNTSGRLSMAGVSKEITLPVEGSLQEDGAYKFIGDYKMNMKKDFDMDPPSAMLGAIKSGEEVTVSFELFFAPKGKK